MNLIKTNGLRDRWSRSNPTTPTNACQCKATARPGAGRGSSQRREALAESSLQVPEVARSLVLVCGEGGHLERGQPPTPPGRGILGLVYGKFSYTKDTHGAKLGPLELSIKDKETVNVPAWAGVVAILAGGVLLVLPTKS